MSKKKPYIAFELDGIEDAEQAARLAGVNPDVIVAGLPRLWRDCWRRKSDRVRPEELGAFFTGGADEKLRRALATKRFLEIDGSPAGDRVKGASRLLRISASKAKGGHAAKGNLKRGTKPGPGICREDEPDPPAEPPAAPRLLQPAASSQQPQVTPPNPLANEGAGSEKSCRCTRNPCRHTLKLVVVPHAPTPAQETFGAVLQAVRDHYGASYAAVQLDRLKPELVGDRLVLHAPDEFFANWIEENHGPMLRDAHALVSGGTGPPPEIRSPPKAEAQA